MKNALNYGRISWAYEDNFDPRIPCTPSPLLTFNPIRINGKNRYPSISDKTSLLLLKLQGHRKLSFKEAYKWWLSEAPFIDRDLGEGRAFLKWLKLHDVAIDWKKEDFRFHAYFLQHTSPKHDPGDEMARDLSFAITPVAVGERRIKLYLKDEAVLNLINMPYGEEEDFLKLVVDYIRMRFQWEKWRAPSPPFLDWVKTNAKKPLFSKGQLGLSLPAIHSTP